MAAPLRIGVEEEYLLVDAENFDLRGRSGAVLARETLICGQHIHVGIDDEERRIDVSNRVRPWLAVLTALSVNSPFWLGVDTGYASYRSQVFRRWPSNRTPRRFQDWADYLRVVEALVACGAVDDPTRLYWDVRPSSRFPTLEFRVTDVCLRVSEAVVIAGPVRGLVASVIADADRGPPVPDPMPEVLEAAAWKAGRHGLEGDLIDPGRNMSMPAAELIHRLLATVSEELQAIGDDETVSQGIEHLLDSGTGAVRQRAVFARSGQLNDVVAFVADETESEA